MSYPTRNAAIFEKTLAKGNYWFFCITVNFALIVVAAAAARAMVAPEAASNVIGFCATCALIVTIHAFRNEKYLAFSDYSYSRPLRIIHYAIMYFGINLLVTSVVAGISGYSLEKVFPLALIMSITSLLVLLWTTLIKSRTIGRLDQETWLTPENVERIMEIGKDYPSLRTEPDPGRIAQAAQAGASSIHELVPITGELTEEKLLHNLSIISDYGEKQRRYAEQIKRYLHEPDDYYEKVDQLVALGGDATAATLLKQKFDATKAEMFNRAKKIILLCTLTDLDPSANEQIEAELYHMANLAHGEAFQQPLREYAYTQIEEMMSKDEMTTAEQYAKIRELADSILTGSRGDKPVTIQEIFPENV